MSGGFYKYRCKYFYTHNCQNWVWVNNAPCATCLVSRSCELILVVFCLKASLFRSPYWQVDDRPRDEMKKRYQALFRWWVEILACPAYRTVSCNTQSWKLWHRLGLAITGRWEIKMFDLLLLFHSPVPCLHRSAWSQLDMKNSRRTAIFQFYHIVRTWRIIIIPGHSDDCKNMQDIEYPGHLNSGVIIPMRRSLSGRSVLLFTKGREKIFIQTNSTHVASRTISGRLSGLQRPWANLHRFIEFVIFSAVWSFSFFFFFFFFFSLETNRKRNHFQVGSRWSGLQSLPSRGVFFFSKTERRLSMHGEHGVLDFSSATNRILVRCLSVQILHEVGY